jgi:hypothetical protein
MRDLSKESRLRTRTLALLIVVVLLGGCAVVNQERNTVFVREAGEGHFDTSAARRTEAVFEETAQKHWVHAVMSESAYHAGEEFPRGPQEADRLAKCAIAPARQTEILSRKPARAIETSPSVGQWRALLAQEKWSPWQAFLSDTTWCAAEDQGLAFQVFEKREGDKVQVVVSFRGTVFSDPENWRANFRWLLQPTATRWPDANIVVQYQVAEELAAELARRYPDRIGDTRRLQISVTGHSLGGALAQQLSYAFPPSAYDIKSAAQAMKVNEVIVFDPSPANGWYWVDAPLRERNAGGVPVTRVFQHGEALAYLRLFLSYVYPPSAGNCTPEHGCIEPKISEVRYNVDCHGESAVEAEKRRWLVGGPVQSHSMELLACGLVTAARRVPPAFPAP